MSPKILPTLLVIGFAGMSVPAIAQMNNNSGTQVVHQLNASHDKDNTLNWNEIAPAAEARFKLLDTDHDGTLSEEEASKAGITAQEFKQASAGSGQTLNQQDYLNLVKARFKAANTDNDQTLTSQELDSQAGQKLVSLLSIKG